MPPNDAEDTTEANRAAMPIAAAWVDEMRALFGEIKVVHVRENGLELGRPGAEGVPATQK